MSLSDNQPSLTSTPSACCYASITINPRKFMKEIKIELLRTLRSFAVVCCLLPAIPARATTYYIDYDSGNDSNSGTSKSSPWQHHPYMYPGSWTGGTFVHSPGDQFIFKGGVTWSYPCFVLRIQSGQGGAADSPDYYGVDKTWYSGSSWSSPVFDAGGYPFGFFWVQEDRKSV